ncbi:uncharacterized protein IL334_005002 [Kwoniella shivajii]|uniref:Uncharacterized protein n=1 Tax=Kwoniella shivajii TaxID=564305 RepID=A0ABZ1D349_9TREE|nr:hypothetical protein IL334_005002 [Kwoniella shivajii]
MSTNGDCNMNLCFILGSSALVFTAHHTCKFDKCKCLVPKKKEWFRVLLTWMLIASEMMLIGWALGWTIIKYQLGWVTMPDIGPLPFPSAMFDQKYVNLNIPYTIIFNLAFSIQASLNAEEGLYWYHLMRAVRQPKSSRSWLSSSFFYAWIIVSVICTVCQSAIGWIHKGNLDLDMQMAKTITVHGVMEFAVMLAASVVIWKFPAFLTDVKASGAGPEVRSRLHFYHEANKIRTFFRALFAVCMMILGIDGMTEAKKINMNPLASGKFHSALDKNPPVNDCFRLDLLAQTLFGSFTFVLVISILLYQPRNWTPESEIRQHRIMVGDNNEPRAGINRPQLASGVALMSLLREGGQWDGDDDLIGENINGNTNKGYQLKSTGSNQWKEERSHVKSDSWESGPSSELGIPMALENFTSPISVPIDSSMPREIKIHMAQELHRDEGI